MPDRMIGKQHKEGFDALLESALMEGLSDALPTEAEQQTEPDFSETFTARISALIDEAGEAQEAERRAETTEAAATRAQARMTDKVIPFAAFRKNHRMIVNAASVLLVFGLGIFFLRQGDAFVRGSRTAALSETGAAAPEAAFYSASPEEESAEEAAGNVLSAAPRMASAPDSAVSESAAYDGAEQSAPLAAGAGRSGGNPLVAMQTEAELRAQSGLVIGLPEGLGSDPQYTLIGGEIAEIRYQSTAMHTELVYRAADAETLRREIGEDIAPAETRAGGEKTGSAFTETEVFRRMQLLSGVYENFDAAGAQELEIDGIGIMLYRTAAGSGGTEQEEKNGAAESSAGEAPETDAAGGALLYWTLSGTDYTLWAEDASAGTEPLLGEVSALLTALEEIGNSGGETAGAE